MFLLVALVATGVAWYVDHHRVDDLNTLMEVLDMEINASFPLPEGFATTFSYRGRRFRAEVR